MLQHATLVDGSGGKPRRDTTVVVRAGKIVDIDPRAVPAGARIVDLSGRWLLPGFIDAHAHLQDLASARAALQAGVTTARVLGVNHYADVGIRDLHRAGATDVPDVLAGGYQVTWPPWDAALLDFPRLRAAFGTRTPEAMAAMVRANASRGVDVIKVLATQRAGLPEQDPAMRQLNDLELAAAISEARRAKLPVAAHAHSDEGARAAVLAGASTLEHGTFVGDETLRLMQQRKVCFVPTVGGWSTQFDGVKDDPVLAARARVLMPRAQAAVARAVEVGVMIAAGSDTSYGGSATFGIADEIAALVVSGMPAARAIQAGTSIAAECLGIAQRTGSVTIGREADLIVVAADPTQQLATLKVPQMVINDGVIVVDRRDQARANAGLDSGTPP